MLKRNATFHSATLVCVPHLAPRYALLFFDFLDFPVSVVSVSLYMQSYATHKRVANAMLTQRATQRCDTRLRWRLPRHTASFRLHSENPLIFTDSNRLAEIQVGGQSF